METSTAKLLRVSATSNPYKVAGAIASVLREDPEVTVQAIGATAVNQAIKSIIHARRFLEGDQLDLVLVPSFYDVELNGAEKTAMRLLVIRRPRDSAETA